MIYHALVSFATVVSSQRRYHLGQREKEYATGSGDLVVVEQLLDFP